MQKLILSGLLCTYEFVLVNPSKGKPPDNELLLYCYTYSASSGVSSRALLVITLRLLRLCIVFLILLFKVTKHQKKQPFK